MRKGEVRRVSPQKNDQIFSGKHVLITGGTSGIGRALAIRASKCGARVSILARDDRLIAEIQDLIPGVHAVGVEVQDRNAVGKAVDACVLRHGNVNFLFASAGIVFPAAFSKLSDDDFLSQTEVNYLGTLWAVRSVLPGMQKDGAGEIVLMSSLAGHLGVFGYGAYGPSKYAIRGLFETLRVELAPVGVKAFCVFPPDVKTPMLAEEERHKPDELRAMGGPPAITADMVVDAIIKGVSRNRPRIFIGFHSKFIAKAAALLPGLVDAVVDRDIRKAQLQSAGSGR
ncbi:SDR family NAD(P)-dependent oxidoreductase [Streptomyces sp. SID5770]|uniref:SDR family NAD(P)-dependent oxidoreductase n=1 Tax=Streptomyces sp. SID5770 TaxID=2690308 RepID=UPI001371A329|nr:SDR family NAD(P)-dependent oxidoreductase [Streptomyces sp. SID5770]MZE52588.1 SDR family NAD(P)-dependent oxidoreductase [Streptomyces sp. SID5770]